MLTMMFDINIAVIVGKIEYKLKIKYLKADLQVLIFWQEHLIILYEEFEFKKR